MAVGGRALDEDDPCLAHLVRVEQDQDRGRPPATAGNGSRGALATADDDRHEAPSRRRQRLGQGGEPGGDVDEAHASLVRAAS